MAYQTGGAISLTNLITQIVNFGTSNGFTSTSAGTLTNDGYTWTFARATGTYSSTSMQWISCNVTGNGTTGFTEARMTTYRNTGDILNYYLFCTDDVLTVTVESTSGIYNHMVFGLATMYDGGTQPFISTGVYGKITGATFDAPSSSQQAVIFPEVRRTTTSTHGTNRCGMLLIGGDTGSPSAVGTWHGLGWYQNSSSTTDGGAGIWDFTDKLTDAGINNGTGRAPLQPINLFTYDNTDSVNFREGYIKGIRVINMSQFAGGAEYTAGSDVWKIFPICEKNGDETNAPNTGNLGFAVLK